MDLIFFDLDGTLLNSRSQISTFTKETLLMLDDKNIAYTVATGRTMLSAQTILKGHEFKLPQIYNNGVTIWDPIQERLTLDNLLDETEISLIIECAMQHGIAPFVNTFEINENAHRHLIYHAPTFHQVEKDLVDKYFSQTDAVMLNIEALPIDSMITNISMIGDSKVISKLWQVLNSHENLIAYSGPAIEQGDFSWMDVHHKHANKGSAVDNVKEQFQASNVICFGDGENDLSMFKLANESYAPDNARIRVKQAANAVIGHHHEDGIAHFLRERFSL